MSTWGLNKDIYFSTHELTWVPADASQSTLDAIGFNPTNTLLVALAIAFVLLMTPGLALFYGGLVRRKSTLTIINQCVASLGITTLIWIFGGFSLAFGPSVGKGIIGDISTYFAFRNLLFADGWSGGAVLVFANFTNGVPLILFFAYQLAFAIITPPLMVGAFADRMKFKNYLVFLVLWQYLIYIPFAHWIWGQGFLAAAGVIDYAGGIVIHTTAGFGALAASFMLGKRTMLVTDKNRANNLPMVVLGATLLFFGWFGFNVGGAGFVKDSSNHISQAISSWLNTIIALAIGMVGWITLETIVNKNHKPTTVGLVTGAIAGLATITPTAGFVPIWASVPIAIMGVLVCYSIAKLLHHFHFDDSLEVLPVHGMGGVVGSLLIGAFATDTVANGIKYNAVGLDSSGNPVYGLLFGLQLGAVALAIVWAFAFTCLIIYISKPRLSAREQLGHIDYINHGEDAYKFDFLIPSEDEMASYEGFDQVWEQKVSGCKKADLASKLVPVFMEHESDCTWQSKSRECTKSK
ncbi:ammonium transporter [Ureaplasma urealyticum]|uniref:Ammonium transporter n=3 Tax=Ureaplasma urealyticum TaxID=2130 RepID=A0AAX1QZH6_UREUR|nr:ammonium transporter [Ureaplasma urealyticum]ACI59804.1 ammonium transporter [Ureaplasma urealyticum serovar 10 str. ATCC 33699]EDT49587.1 ammonium transporter [Ureaplasma urealyticum serovar 13 str. ATCC 33698]MCF1348885.1 ammonium transporter [Ureaplasma urealyticum]QDI63581.1 ammonium transporter [Ureaplasma urealyticum]RCJ01382.1 ammonium transporter [Ureaplasma urealyticum]